MTFLLRIAELLLPLFVTLGAGYGLGKIFDLSEDTLIRVLTDFVAPLLIFQSLYRSDLSGELVLRIGGAAFFVVIFLGLISYGWSLGARIDRKTYLPPILFYNTGFLGIPLMYLWGGTEAMNIIVVYDQMQGIAIFTIGILIVTGGFSWKGLKDVFFSPILWAVVAGFFCRYAAIPVPEVLLRTASFGGEGMGSLAAFSLGVALTRQQVRLNHHLAVALFLRVVGGFLFGLLACRMFGLAGKTALVFVVGSALPSAVFSFIITRRYGADASFAGSMILISTCLSILTLPLTFWAAETMLSLLMMD